MYPAEKLSIVTHCDRSHTDEIAASAILNQCELWNGILMRTRDEKLIESQIGNTFIIDVGRVYNPDTLQFDHHQESFHDTYSPEETITRLSSCGLIYKHYKERLFEKVMEKDYPELKELLEKVDIKSLMTEKMYADFYAKYIREIDANDNGVSQIKDEYDPSVYRYRSHWYLPFIVSESNCLDVKNDQEQMKRFLENMEIIGKFIERAVVSFLIRYISTYLAKETLRKETILSVGKYGILVLSEKIDYEEAAKELFRERDEYWVFTIVPHGAEWRIHTVRDDPDSFKHRLSIMCEDDARELVGDDLVFVHRARFTGGAKTKESAIKIAEETCRRVTE